MIKAIRSVFLWAAAAIICIVLLVFNADAAAMIDESSLNGYKPGPGDHYDEDGNIVSISGDILVDSEGNVIVSNTIADGSSSTDYGTLSGNTPASAPATGSAGYISSFPATLESPASEGINYTTSEEDGSVIYVFEGKNYTIGDYCGEHKLCGYSGEAQGTGMTTIGKNAGPSHTMAASSEYPLGTVLIIKGTDDSDQDYNGMYVVEDRGGYYLEYEGWLDIYFDTEDEAGRITEDGWNYVYAWIAEPLE